MPVVSFDDARNSIRFDPNAAIKSLAFILPDQSFVLVGLRMSDRADYKRIANALNARRADLKMASPEQLETGLRMSSGSIAPLPVRGSRVLIDENVFGLEIIYCGSGDPGSILEIAAADLARIADARVCQPSRRQTGCPGRSSGLSFPDEQGMSRRMQLVPRRILQCGRSGDAEVSRHDCEFTR